MKDNDSVARSYTAVGRKSRLRPGKFIALVVLFMAACFTAGFGGAYTALNLGDSSINRAVTHDGNTVVSQEEEDISTVASRVGPSVVSVVTQSQTRSYFGTQSEQGAGSGIILTADGYVLTNKHVISGSQQLAVITSDGTTHEDVKVIGTDPLNDLAFIKINGVNGLTPATLGDSSSIRIGQKVVAIGNSLGEFQNTVTSGIISGTGRPISAQDGNNSVETLTDLIQTDAAINPGNSGGPLTNLSGQVIGINTAVAEDAQSIGFAIPINSAKGIIKNLQKTGKVERGYLGVNYVTITPDVAKQHSLPVKKGGYVIAEGGSAVISGSPAAKAGIKDKDIITKVSDIEVGEKGSVASLVAEYGTGEMVELTLLRDGKTMTVKVTLETYSS